MANTVLLNCIYKWNTTQTQFWYISDDAVKNMRYYEELLCDF